MDNNTENLAFLRPMMNISEMVPYLKQKSWKNRSKKFIERKNKKIRSIKKYKTKN